VRDRRLTIVQLGVRGTLIPWAAEASIVGVIILRAAEHGTLQQLTSLSAARCARMPTPSQRAAPRKVFSTYQVSGSKHL